MSRWPTTLLVAPLEQAWQVGPQNLHAYLGPGPMSRLILTGPRVFCLRTNCLLWRAVAWTSRDQPRGGVR